MNYGFYQSATGLMTQVHRLQVSSNNLANSETFGFKADQVTTAQRLPARLERQCLHRGRDQRGDRAGEA